MKRTLLRHGHRRRRARRRAGRVGRGPPHRRHDDAQARPRHRRRARRARRLRRAGRPGPRRRERRALPDHGRAHRRPHRGRDDPSRRRPALLGGRRSLTLRAPRVAVGRKIMLSAARGRRPRRTCSSCRARASAGRASTRTSSGLRARLTQKAATALNATFGVTRVQEGPAARHGERALAHRRGGHPGAQRHLARGRSRRTRGAHEPRHRPRRDRSGDARRARPRRFPISGGRVKLDLSAGTIRHRGGISLTKGATVVRLESFDVRLGDEPAAVRGDQRRRAEGGDPRPRPHRGHAGGRRRARSRWPASRRS